MNKIIVLHNISGNQSVLKTFISLGANWVYVEGVFAARPAKGVPGVIVTVS